MGCLQQSIDLGMSSSMAFLLCYAFIGMYVCEDAWTHMHVEVRKNSGVLPSAVFEAEPLAVCHCVLQAGLWASVCWRTGLLWLQKCIVRLSFYMCFRDRNSYSQKPEFLPTEPSPQLLVCLISTQGRVPIQLYFLIYMFQFTPFLVIPACFWLVPFLNAFCFWATYIPLPFPHHPWDLLHPLQGWWEGSFKALLLIVVIANLWLKFLLPKWHPLQLFLGTSPLVVLMWRFARILELTGLGGTQL